MKVTLLNSILLTENRARTLMAVLALAVLLSGAGWAQAVPISIKLTTDALGLGSSDINRGGTVDPDMPGFITSPTTGEGSILYIQTDGLAGPGTANPLFVTVTAKTRMDVITGLPPAPHDYQAGVLFISKEDGGLPDGSKEGLGVRAFEVDVVKLERKIDSGSGAAMLAEIEGSPHVSGGTEPYPDLADKIAAGKLNTAPHVDESVTFDFIPQFYANALSVEVLLSKFDLTDIIDLHIDLTSRPDIYLEFLQTTDTSIFEQVGADKDKLWKLKFSGIGQLQTGDLIQNFTIFANDDNPQNPSGTAEHFLITGMTAVPEPATICLLGFGALSLIRRKRSV